MAETKTPDGKAMLRMWLVEHRKDHRRHMTRTRTRRGYQKWPATLYVNPFLGVMEEIDALLTERIENLPSED